MQSGLMGDFWTCTPIITTPRGHQDPGLHLKTYKTDKKESPPFPLTAFIHQSPSPHPFTSPVLLQVMEDGCASLEAHCLLQGGQTLRQNVSFESLIAVGRRGVPRTVLLCPAKHACNMHGARWARVLSAGTGSTKGRAGPLPWPPTDLLVQPE